MSEGCVLLFISFFISYYLLERESKRERVHWSVMSDLLISLNASCHYISVGVENFNRKSQRIQCATLLYFLKLILIK